MSTENTPGPSAGGAEGSRRLQENGRRGDGASSAFRDAFSLRGGTDGDPEGDPLEDLGAGDREESEVIGATWPPVIAVVLGVILALVLAIAHFSFSRTILGAMAIMAVILIPAIVLWIDRPPAHSAGVAASGERED